MENDRSQISGDIHATHIGKILNKDQIEQFIETGILVVPDLVPLSDILEAKQGLYSTLREYNVNPNDLENTAQNLQKLSSTGGAGGILDIFYAKWRMKICEHPNIFAAISDLWEATYSKNLELFTHPFGEFNPKQGYMYINRVCYRIPDRLSQLHAVRKSKPLQRSLTPHLDCCPQDLYNSGKEFPRWRPIQSLTALTPNNKKNIGGFEAVPGFHKEFSQYFTSSNYEPQNHRTNRSPVCIGDFSPLRTQEDREIIQRYQHISYDVGSVVFWDWRIPHANSYEHQGDVSREVVYTEYLPNIPMNRAYAKEQMRRYQMNLLPSDHWQKNTKTLLSYDMHHFTSLGSRLIGLHPWE